MTAIPLRRLAARLRSERSGQVTLLFGLLVIPMLCAVGAALDYSRQRAAKVRLDSALDAAVLSVASRKTNTFDEAEVRRTLDRQFRTQVGGIQNLNLPASGGLDVKVVAGASAASITASYDATLDTFLTRLMGFRGMALKGTATASRKYDDYIDFYLLLDNSPSMGLAATDADIAKMEALTDREKKSYGTCAFACHETPKNGLAENYSDLYWFAKQKGIKLRIDNVREAAASLVDRAQQDQTLPNQYRMAIYTFSDDLVALSPLTTSYATTKAKALGIDMVRSYADESDKQTSYIKVLPKMTEIIPASGTGRSEKSPIRFLFFVTDGVQDSPLFGSYMANGKYDAVQSANGGGGAGTGRFMGAMNPALCDAMKAKGIQVGVLYTKYYPIPSNDWYNTWIKPFDPILSPSMRACASSDQLYAEVSTDGDISDALRKLFIQAVASVRLTR